MTTPQVIRWEEPPPAKRYSTTGVGHSSYAPLAEELRARPDEWALVLDRPGRDTGLANHIRMGQMLCFAPAGDFDAVSRQVDGRTLVYARYLGDPDNDWTLR